MNQLITVLPRDDIQALENVLGSRDLGIVRTGSLIALWVLISISGQDLHGQELGRIPAELGPISTGLPQDPVVDVSGRTLRHLASDVTAAILRIREENHLPRLKPLHPSEINQFCDTSRFGIGSGVHHMGSNPITGTRTVLFFEAHSPLEARLELEEIALQERPHGKKGNLAIDDAHRIAVQVCPSHDHTRYRVVVGYWYSRMGVFLDSIPRGNE